MTHEHQTSQFEHASEAGTISQIDMTLLTEEQLAGMAHAFDYVAKKHSPTALQRLFDLASTSFDPEAALLAEAVHQEQRYRSLASESIPGERESGIVFLDKVEPERVQPLWEGFIYRSKLNVLDGDPGLGKTTVLIDIASRITVGGPMPDGTAGLNAPASVVLLMAEDGLGDTIRPRLDAAGADAGRVVAITGVPDFEGEELRPVELPLDVGFIEQIVIAQDAAMVIIDPLMAFLGRDTNSHSDQDIRRALAQISASAERTGAAWVVIRHLNKSSGGHAIYRGGGSIGIIGAARSGMLVAKDPDDATESRRILASTKNNLGPTPTAVAFQVEGDENDGSRICWEGSTHHTANDLLRSSDSGDGRGSRLAEAIHFVVEMLSNGPMSVKDLERAAAEIGIAQKTLQRAKKDLGVNAVKSGFGPGAAWFCELPKSANMATSDQRRPPGGEATFEENGHLRDDRLIASAQNFCTICGGLCANPECRSTGLCLSCISTQD